MQEQRVMNAAAMVGPALPPLAARGYLLRVWDHWKQVAHAVGVVQTRFLMLLIYVIVVVPTGLLMRLGRDPLHLRPPAQGNWTPTHQHERSVDAARRQF